MCCAFLGFIFTHTVASHPRALHFQMPALVFSKQASHTQMFTYPTTQKSKGEGATGSMHVL